MLIRRWKTLRQALGLVASGVVLACAAAAPAWALDDPPGRVGRVAEVRGQAWMQAGGQGEWFALQRNRPVTTADHLSTDRDSRLQLEIGSSVVRLDGGADLVVQRLDDERIDLQLLHGSAAVRIREPEVIREFSLQVTEGSLLPGSTGLFRVERGEPDLQVSALSGEWSLQGAPGYDGLSHRLRAGQRLIVRRVPGARAPELTWAALADDDFERWVRQEDARDVPRVARGPVSPEMTGADDLGQYGRWEDHPDYGSVWTPTVVAAGWAPYRHGRWAFISPWGWTWVDEAPWGFAPFHYGRWLFWGGHWCWAPGQYVRRPVYAPALVGWVHGPSWGASVTVGSGPVGWVPLGPQEVFVPVYRTSPTYVQVINNTHIYLPPNYRPAPPPPGRPIYYSNQAAPGGLTAVAAQVFQHRLPVAPNLDHDEHGGFPQGGSRPGQWVGGVPPRPPVSGGTSDAPTGSPAPGGHPWVPPGRPPLDHQDGKDSGGGSWAPAARPTTPAPFIPNSRRLLPSEPVPVSPAQPKFPAPRGSSDAAVEWRSNEPPKPAQPGFRTTPEAARNLMSRPPLVAPPNAQAQFPTPAPAQQPVPSWHPNRPEPRLEPRMEPRAEPRTEPIRVPSPAAVPARAPEERLQPAPRALPQSPPPNGGRAKPEDMRRDSRNER